jgi:hypothetical protein
MPEVEPNMTKESPSLFRYYGHTLLPEEKPLENSGLKVLQELSLKVTPPSEFNDVFELTPVIERPVTEDEARTKLRTAIGGECREKGLPGTFANDLAEVVLALKPNQADLNFVTQQSIAPTISQRYGIVCFSIVPDDLLMWAHYAAHNHGIMLEFDPEAPMFQGPRFFRVEYNENRLISETQPSEEIKQAAALARRKSRLWENEAEHRLVVPLDQTTKIVTDSGKPIYLLKVNPEWIRSITVGQRASFEIKSEINRLIRRPDLSHLQAERYRMFMDPKIFRLNRKRISNF